MITFFTTPKPFTQEMGVIQRNALNSWRTLSSEVQIILFGNSPGCKEAAQMVDGDHIPEVDSYQDKIPYVDSMFINAEKLSNNQTLCYVNADIILPTAFLQAADKLVELKKYLMIGYRYDLDWNREIDFSSQASVEAFWSYAEKHSVKHAPTGIDYFLFSRGLWKHIPRFITGRMSWDNWLIWRARRNFAKVVDATPLVKAIHQNHDYSLVAGGEKGVREGRETIYNEKLLNKRWAVGTLADATWLVSEKGIARKNSPKDMDCFYDRIWRVYPEIAYPLIYFGRLRLWVKKLLGIA